MRSAAAFLLLAAAAGAYAAAASDTAASAAAALKASPGDRAALLRAVELLPDSPPSADLDASARLLLSKAPSDFAGYLALCKVLRGSARPEEAVANCRRALELEPTAYPPYRELALAYAAAGEKARARETLEQAVELSSASYKARYDLAALLERSGEAAAALPHYRKAAALAAADKGPDGAYYAARARGGLRRTQAAPRKARADRKKTPAAAAAPAPAPGADPGAGQACRKKAGDLAEAGDTAGALAQSELCLKQLPSSPALAAMRAPLLVRLGRYEEGVAEYERAARLYASTPPLSAFSRIKAAETWLKLGSPARAIEQYRLALKTAPSDLNALRGLAAAQEKTSDLKGASETYAAILKAEPSDARARTRLEELRAASLSDAQVLEELRLRLAVPESRASLLPEDKRLFEAIFAAELGGGVDLVKARAPGTKGLVARRKAGEGARLVLTGAGYKAYVSFATMDAVKFFEEEGVGLREIFQLRTLSGDKIFDQAGKLTPEGEELWRRAKKGEKTWLLPFDPVPQSRESKQSEEAAAQMAQWAGEGYTEISEPEYLWLLKATACPDSTLKSPPVVAAKEIFDGIRNRYLLCTEGNKPCMNQCNSRLPEYIASYRSSGPEAAEARHVHGAFFGTGAKKRKYCVDGEVWIGNIGAEHNPCSTASAVR